MTGNSKTTSNYFPTRYYTTNTMPLAFFGTMKRYWRYNRRSRKWGWTYYEKYEWENKKPKDREDYITGFVIVRSERTTEILVQFHRHRFCRFRRKVQNGRMMRLN